MTQQNLSKIWEMLKSGHDFKSEFPPVVVIDDEAEQVMTIPLPAPDFDGITVGRKNDKSNWELK